VPCYRPLKGYRAERVNPATGKRSIVFSPRDGYYDFPINLPCGQCIGCRLERSRQWAIRCQHEASLYDDNCFITLTYDNESLPRDGSLQVKHHQDFMKRLRFRFGSNIRFFNCGEYGEKFARPHYHTCLFNFDFPDKKPWRRTKAGHQIWRSDALEELWPQGMSEIGSVTFESAAYVARYITKKVTGDRAEAHYEFVNTDTGEIVRRHPEYTTMSRRPGIGKPWLEKHGFRDCYPSDFITIRGRKMRPPRYYDNQYELAQPSDFKKVVWRRRQAGKEFSQREPESRLAVREECSERKLTQLRREYEG